MDSANELTIEPLARLTGSAIEDWERLVSSTGANYSLSHGWTNVIANSHRIGERAEVATVREKGTILAVLPIIIEQRRLSGVNLRVLDLVSNLVSYHNGPVGSVEPTRFLEILLAIARKRGADVIRLAGVCDDSDFGRLLASDPPVGIALHVHGEISPYLVLPSDWNELLAAKSKKFRYKVRKRAETLDTSDVLSMKWFDEPTECAELLRAMNVVEANSWKKDAGISIFDREHERRYHEDLLPFLAGNRAMFANVLYLDDNPIAYNLCCIRDGWVGQLKTSFDTAHSELSPGSIVIDHAIRRAIESGANEFDFLGDQDPHKLAWTKDVRPHSDHFFYLRSSFRGRLIGTLKKAAERFK